MSKHADTVELLAALKTMLDLFNYHGSITPEKQAAVIKFIDVAVRAMREANHK